MDEEEITKKRKKKETKIGKMGEESKKDEINAGRQDQSLKSALLV